MLQLARRAAAAHRCLAHTRALTTTATTTTTTTTPLAENVVIIPWAKLQSTSSDDERDILQSIERAYGAHGLGLLLVSGVPGYVEARQGFLPLIHEFSSLPESTRLKYERADKSFAVGWVHGKEMLGTGEPDLLKATYKGNPLYDRPGKVAGGDAEELYPEYFVDNVWPEEVEAFGPAFMHLGGIMTSVGRVLGRHCDAYVNECLPGWREEKDTILLEKTVADSKCAKGRALHYYAPSPEQAEQQWCGWHNDHGSLTALTSAMFFDRDGVEVDNPDPAAGLVVAPRQTSGLPEQVKVVIPRDHLAFQIGETSQVLSGGHLMATPHMVKGPANKDTVERGVSRSTMAIFMQPDPHQVMRLPAKTHLDNAVESSPLVPALADRWTNGATFGDFTKNTLGAYYEQVHNEAQR